MLLVKRILNFFMDKVETKLTSLITLVIYFGLKVFYERGA